MNLKTLFGFTSAVLLTCGVACMDVSPPNEVSQNEEVILHSVRLPFSRAIYGVGDIDTISLTAVLMNGDTVLINPLEVQWKVSPVQTAASVDSAGVFTASSSSASLAKDGVKLIASYLLNGVTKSDTAPVYVTDRRYDIKSFELQSADSARGGSLSQSYALLSLQLGEHLDFSQLNLEIKDVNDISPEQISLENHFSRFLTSAQTGKRFIKQKITIFIPPNYPVGLYINPNAPVGDYWIGLETYIYGKSVKDSVLFKQLRSGEILFTAGAAGSSVSISGGTIVQPCATALIRNSSRDTLIIDLPASTEDCEGYVRRTGERLSVAPGYRGRLRVLGYKQGTRVQWRAFKASDPSREIGGGEIEMSLSE